MFLFKAGIWGIYCEQATVFKAELLHLSYIFHMSFERSQLVLHSTKFPPKWIFIARFPPWQMLKYWQPCLYSLCNQKLWVSVNQSLKELSKSIQIVTFIKSDLTFSSASSLVGITLCFSLPRTAIEMYIRSGCAKLLSKHSKH